mmetsp:Transcript_22923/g.17380  ORF Transcript_22923/g.17380 Transcript_22923/m.17380 type:complete len:87 (-) Transcript_22923:214-474(-)
MPYQGKTMVLMNKFQNGAEEEQREGSCKSVLHKHKFGTLHSRAYAEVHQISLDMQESKQFDFGVVTAGTFSSKTVQQERTLREEGN